MEKKKKKQFVRPTVRLLEDVDALPLLTASVGGDGDETLLSPMFTGGTGDNADTRVSGTRAFRGGF